MGGQSAGGIPFGSGSYYGSGTVECTNPGAGEGNTFGGSGWFCWDNINDGVQGNSNSWIANPAAYNGRYFAGIKFPATQYVRGVRISRDSDCVSCGYNDRYSANINVYVVRSGQVASPAHTTSTSLWECVGYIPARANMGFFWYEFPTELDASAIIVEPTNTDGVFGNWPCIDELAVYARVSSCLDVYVPVNVHTHKKCV